MRVLIVEDEPMAAAHLQSLLLQCNTATVVVGIADNTHLAAKLITELNPELIFMDIQLGDSLSFNIFQMVSFQTPVIFTTAFSDYAIKAFEANGIAYLLKPIQKPDLEKALLKYQSLRELAFKDFDILVKQMQEKNIPTETYRDRFLVTQGAKLRSVTLAEIAWFCADGRYSKLKTLEGLQYLIDDTLEKLEKSLPPQRFFRVNRQYIVSFEAIETMVPYSKSRLMINLNPPAEEEIVVSVERSSTFKDWLNR